MIFVIIISLGLYILGGVMIWHNTYNLEKSKKIKLIIIAVIATIIITQIIVNISASKIETDLEKELNMAKIIANLLFSPINLILLAPYIGNLLNKYEVDRININQLEKRILILLVILFIIMIFEANYINNFQAGALQGLLK